MKTARPPAISTTALSRAFGNAWAVRELSLDIGRGELFGLVGPDGAGKTTTLRMLAGVLPPTSGDAEIEGTSITRDPEGVKHHIAYMSQRFGLYTDLTVRENIDFYADLYQVPARLRPARIRRLYDFSNLGPFEHRLAGQLSGGMRQKLSLCCALVHRPDVVLLDEPTFGVDPISRRDLWLIIHQMVADGVTALVSTAYLDEAERCDRVGLLHEGHVVALDTPVALQARLEGHVAALVTDQPRAARNIARETPGIDQAILFGEHLRIVSRRIDEAITDLTARLQRSGIAVRAHTRVPPSLEDVFIHLVQSVSRA